MYVILISIPSSDAKIEWNSIRSIISDMKNDPLYIMYTHDNRIDNIKNAYIHMHNISSVYKIEYIVSHITEIYWYLQCIEDKGYDIHWKHSERLYYDQWNIGRRDIVKMCTVMKSEWDHYEIQVKNMIDQGVSIEEAKNSCMPSNIHRDALIRYSAFKDLISFCNHKIDGIH